MSALTHSLTHSLTGLPFALLTAAALAQTPTVHEHVADKSVHPLAGIYIRSNGALPLFNLPDADWNLGEEIDAPNTTSGPFELHDPSTFIDATNVDQYVEVTTPWSSWSPAGNPTQRFVGTIEPPFAAPATPIQAAFELFAPDPLDPDDPVLLVIGNWATAAHPTTARSLYEYPGTNPEGLPLDPTGIRRALDPNDWIQTHPGLPANVQVVLVSYVPALFSVRPDIFTHRRLLEVDAVVKAMFNGPSAATHPNLIEGEDPLEPLEVVATALVGASNGGLTTSAALLLWPDRFQAGMSTGWGGSLEGTFDQHEFWQVSSALSGFGATSKGPMFLDILQMSAFWGALETDQHSISFGRRFVDRPGEPGRIRRPMVFIVSDEDTVGAGTDWVPMLKNASTYDQTGSATSPTTSATAYWSRVDKRCHLGGDFKSPTLPGVSYTAGLTVLEAQREVAALAYAERNTAQPPLPVAERVVTDHGLQTPYRGALKRDRSHMLMAPAFPLVEDPGWTRRGLGGGLGYDESLVVDGEDIYVGSADGVVSRCRLAPNPTIPGGDDTIAVVNQSEPLGYAAWGLAVGVVNGQRTVVAGTHRGIYLLDATTLAVLLYTPTSGFGEVRPRRIEVADVYPEAGAASNEIILTTFGGKLMVFDFNLSCIGEYFEPGIIDFVVHPFRLGVEEDETSSNTITIASARGVLASIELGSCALGRAVEARLVASSSHLDPFAGQARYGEIVDLEVYGSAPHRRIAVLYRGTGAPDTIRIFDATSLALLQVVNTNVGNALAITNGRATSPLNVDLCVVEDGQNPWAVVCVPETKVWMVPLGVGSANSPSSNDFPPLFRPLACAQMGDKVVFSNEGGYLSWVPVAELQSLATLSGRSSATIGPFGRSTSVLSATWGLVVDAQGEIQAADQTGSQWTVDPVTGSTALTQALTSGGGDPFAAPSPFSPVRDLGIVPVVSGNSLPAGMTFSPPVTGGGNFSAALDPFMGNFFTIADDLVSSVERPSQDLMTLAEIGRWFAQVAVFDGYVPFAFGGDVLHAETHWWAQFWQGAPVSGAMQGSATGGWKVTPYPNMLLGLRGQLSGATSVVDQGWHSFPQTLNVGPGSNDTKDLRNAASIATGGAPFQMQSLRAVRVNTRDLVVVSTAGGSIAVMEPGSAWETPGQYGELLYPLGTQVTDDFGWGGLGLAIRVVGTNLEVYHGVAVAHDDPSAAQACGSVVRTVFGVPASGAVTVVSQDEVRLHTGIAGVSRNVLGVAGLAIGDLLPTSAGSELVVTSILGDVLILQLDGGPWDAVLGHTWFAGGVGVSNGILIDDIDGSPGAELYLAGSFGMRKLVRP